MKEFYENYTSQIKEALDTVDRSLIETIAEEIVHFGNIQNTIYSFGNGASASLAEHLATDFTKGIQTDTNIKSNIVSLVSNPAMITAIANDISYDDIFSEQLKMLGPKHYSKHYYGVIGISASGSSPNVVKALEYAKSRGKMSIAFVGFDGGIVKKEKLAHHILHIPVNNYGIVEDCHNILMHTIAQYIRTRYQCLGARLKL